MDDAFGHWLAGLIDGEGSFCIAERHGTYFCTFRVHLRADDRPMLERIHEATGIGFLIDFTPHGRQVCPTAAWIIQRKSDCVKLIEILHRYELRSKKRLDFETWEAAVEVWSDVKRTGINSSPAAKQRNTDLWARVRALKGRLEAERVYGYAA